MPVAVTALDQVRPQVEDMLCLALHAVSRAMTSRYRSLLEPFGITYPQYLVLRVLQQERRASMVEVGSMLRLESSTLSPLVRRLEVLGHLTRRRSSGDERNVDLQLTDAGSALCAAMEGVPDQISAATGLNGDDQRRLTEQLRDLERNLRGGPAT